MATLENLTDQNVGALKETFQEKILATNPEAKLNVYEQKSVTERLSEVESKVDAVLSRLNLIFGDQCLVNGQFQRVPMSDQAGVKKVG